MSRRSDWLPAPDDYGSASDGSNVMLIALFLVACVIGFLAVAGGLVTP